MKSSLSNRRRFLAASAIAGSTPFGRVFAQASNAWPQKVIKIIVPNPPGGTADLLPRLLTEQLSAKLGQPVIIENKIGAAGNIAAEFLFNAEPDGHLNGSATTAAFDQCELVSEAQLRPSQICSDYCAGYGA
jgi:tripartite-type tricarboxylate transporter receptor subunit TctC